MAGLGRKVFTRERATSSDVQGYLMDQTVMIFASVSARDAAIPSGSRSVGMTTRQLDTLTMTVWDGSAWRRCAGVRTVGRVALGSGLQTDGAGVLTIPHGLGGFSTNIQVTTGPQGSDLLNRVGDVRLTNYDATNLVVRLIRTDTSEYVPNSPLGFEWSAERG